jgi:hypothetical protein
MTRAAAALMILARNIADRQSITPLQHARRLGECPWPMIR